MVLYHGTDINYIIKQQEKADISVLFCIKDTWNKWSKSLQRKLHSISWGKYLIDVWKDYTIKSEIQVSNIRIFDFITRSHKPCSSPVE